MQARRRSYLTAPGETLLLAADVSTIASRSEDWDDLTGLPSERSIVSPVTSVPVPIYHQATIAREVRPSALWHPMLWLPRRLAGRFHVKDDDGVVVKAERDEVWALRVVIEMMGSNLYDPQSGTWLDVLAVYGLDVDDEFTRHEIAEWQKGSPHEVLDSVDLDQYLFREEDPHWAVYAAEAIWETMKRSSWAIIANDLLATVLQAEDMGLDLQITLDYAVNTVSADLDEPSFDFDRVEKQLTIPDKLLALTEELGRIRDANWDNIAKAREFIATSFG